MSQEVYNKEVSRQINNTQMEVQALINDYQSCTDEVCKSQIKTFLEKKEHILLSLLKEVKHGNTE